MPSTGAPPERVLSGLTLALLMANNNDDDDDTTTDGTAPKSDTHHRDPSLNEQHTIREDYVARNIDENSVAERTRRAALHEMPRHLLEQQHDHHHHHPHAMLAAASGDYGYGYNNHIPWQKIHPSQSNPALDLPQQQQYPSSQSFGRTLSTSPASVTSSPLHTIHSIPQTPPGAIFLGATPPHKGSNLGQHHFIPPRNRTESRSITPPFQPRPLGFAHDPPTLHLESQQLASNRSLDSAAKESGSMKAPVSSLDSLRSSPFQQQETLSLHPDSRSMMLSSLSYAPALGSDGLSNMMPNSASGDLRRSLWGGASGAVLPSSLAGSVGLQQHPMFQQHEDYYSEEMPFAVELPSVSSGLQNDDAISQQGSSTARPTSCSSSYLGTSAALTTLAHKCGAPNQRLKLLDNRNVDPLFGSESRPCAAVPDDNPMSSLANQLEEFRTFGASLHVSTMDPSNLLDEHLQGSGASSSTTPSISLRS